MYVPPPPLTSPRQLRFNYPLVVPVRDRRTRTENKRRVVYVGFRKSDRANNGDSFRGDRAVNSFMR